MAKMRDGKIPAVAEFVRAHRHRADGGYHFLANCANTGARFRPPIPIIRANVLRRVPLPDNLSAYG
jgi:hypothetical protein